MAYPGEPLSPFVVESGGGAAVPALSPLAIKRWIAIEMRRLREAAPREDGPPGVDVAEAAQRIGKAKTVVHHIETGRNLPAPADLEVLLNLYGVPERTPFFRELVKTAKRGKDWWVNGFDTVVPEWFTLYLGLESAAARISRYDALWIPGPFQTRPYAEALYRARALPPAYDEDPVAAAAKAEEEMTKAVDLRMARQKLREESEHPSEIRCVLDQNALDRAVGGAEVMIPQLDRLAELAESPGITVQILVHAAGAHAGAEGTFAILDYPDEFEGDPGTAYVDTLPRGLYYERPDEVDRYRRVFQRLTEQAEDPDRTLELISTAKKELT
ncbi:helix-turn-helix transcriptional regulator [Streptomyces sp. AA4]|nr:helix-turn-helix transcriptional regulator [Streptomyces sp. AA4]